MTHRQIIIAGLTIGGIIFVGFLAVLLLITAKPVKDALLTNETVSGDVSNTARTNTDTADIDGNLNCLNHPTLFTSKDYTYDVSGGGLKLVASKDFPVRLNIAGDFTVEQDSSEWPFIFQGKLKSTDISIRQGLAMYKYGDACSKRVGENFVAYHAMASEQGNEYWKNEMPNSTVIKSGTKTLASDGTIYHWYLFKFNAPVGALKSDGGDYYSIHTFAYKGSVDYRYSYNFKILGVTVDESVNSNDFDGTIDSALQIVALFEI